MLVLNEGEVRDRIDMDRAIAWLERCFACMASGQVIVAPRERVPIPGGYLHVMGGSLPCEDLVGSKLYTTLFDPSGERRSSCVVAFSITTGRRVATVESYWMSLVRTAATTALATRYLSSADAATLAIIGTGATALPQVEATLAVREFELVRVYSRNSERRAQFAREIQERHAIRSEAPESLEAAVADADVVITATNSREPVVRADWLRAGSLVVAMGSNYPDRRELEGEVVRLADSVYVDSLPAARSEAGDLILAHEEGLLDWSQVRELGEVVASGHPIAAAASWYVFKSVGILPQDLAMIAYLLHDDRVPTRDGA